MNPYKIKISELKESKKIDDGKELIKLELVAAFLKITATMDTEDILNITKLDKSDLSRIRALNTKRFSIDRIISLIDLLGYSTRCQVRPKVS